MPRSSATGCHATTRSLATSATSTTSGTGTTFSARATASRPSTSRDSRASSSSAPASSCPVVSGSGRVRGEQVQPQPQRGQRGAQLVRHVRDDGPVPVHQGLQPPGHGVERRGQPAQLRGTGVDHGPDGQVTVGQPPAAVSSPASGLLTHRARPNASRAAPTMATTAIVPRMTQSLTMLLFSDAVDLARITVPINRTCHAGRPAWPRRSATRWPRCAPPPACPPSSRAGPARRPGWPAGSSCRRHALVDQPDVVLRAA